jgi:hypothetical protein
MKWKRSNSVGVNRILMYSMHTIVALYNLIVGDLDFNNAEI